MAQVEKWNGMKFYLAGKTIRWQAQDIPIPVLITPLHWYQEEVQRQSQRYTEMAEKALDAWEKASDGVIRFQVVHSPPPKGIQVIWRRVGRNYLGICHWKYGPSRIMSSATVEIGLTDGTLHSSHANMASILGTILHEFGHALGLDHSWDPQAILYGRGSDSRTRLSKTDIQMLQWNYRLPPGFDYYALARELKLEKPWTLDRVMQAAEQSHPDFMKQAQTPLPRIQAPQTQEPLKLAQQQELLTDLGKYYMLTQPKKPPLQG